MKPRMRKIARKRAFSQDWRQCPVFLYFYVSPTVSNNSEIKGVGIAIRQIGNSVSKPRQGLNEAKKRRIRTTGRLGPQSTGLRLKLELTRLNVVKPST